MIHSCSMLTDCFCALDISFIANFQTLQTINQTVQRCNDAYSAKHSDPWEIHISPTKHHNLQHFGQHSYCGANTYIQCCKTSTNLSYTDKHLQSKGRIRQCVSGCMPQTLLTPFLQAVHKATKSLLNIFHNSHP